MRTDYLELVERSYTGPVVKKNDWDIDYIVMNTREMVKKYNLRWDNQVIVTDSPDLADRVFQAGLELVKKTGVYCGSTERLIQLSAEEIEAGLRSMPTELVMGEGEDARVLFARKIGDSRPPLVWAGNPGVPTPENIFQPMVMSWMKEPIVDLVTCGSLVTHRGKKVRTGEPSEILAVRDELRLMREGLIKVGRPGMGMLAAQSSVSELGDLAAAHPDYLRPCDSHLVALFNELIIDHGNMNRAANSIQYGMRNASLATVMVGGLAGDAPGAAVVQVASMIAANLVCLADYHLLHPIHIRHVATTTRGVMWVQSIVQQAFARNAPCIIVADIYPKSGAMTRELLYEVAANAIAITVSGGHLEGVGAADGAFPNSSGLEARLMGEVGRSVARMGLDLNSANALILKLIEKYEHVFKAQGQYAGVCFDRAYNLTTLTPCPEWQQMYDEVCQDLAGFGLML